MSGGIAGRWREFAVRPGRSWRDLPFWPLIPLGALHRALLPVMGRPEGRGGGVRLPRPVVSVGNLTVGGTGKSPATVLAAGILASAGLRPVILSRGYRREGRGTVVVSDGTSVRATAAAGGDEPVMMAAALPGVPVYVDAVRLRAAASALIAFPEAVFVLDDGFSHRGLARDLDIVVIDASCPFGNRRLLPAGILREPVSALGRAGLVILNRAGLVDREALDGLRSEVASLCGGAPVLTADYRAAGLVPLTPPTSPGETRGLPVLSFAGIVNHRHFTATLEGAGVRVIGHVPFADHHRYTAADLGRLDAIARDAGAEMMVTTAKDAVKIDPSWIRGVPLSRLDIAMEVSDAPLLRRALLDAVRHG